MGVPVPGSQGSPTGARESGAALPSYGSLSKRGQPSCAQRSQACSWAGWCQHGPSVCCQSLADVRPQKVTFKEGEANGAGERAEAGMGLPRASSSSPWALPSSGCAVKLGGPVAALGPMSLRDREGRGERKDSGSLGRRTDTKTLSFPPSVPPLPIISL